MSTSKSSRASTDLVVSIVISLLPPPTHGDQFSSSIGALCMWVRCFGPLCVAAGGHGKAPVPRGNDRTVICTKGMLLWHWTELICETLMSVSWTVFFFWIECSYSPWLENDFTWDCMGSVFALVWQISNSCAQHQKYLQRHKNAFLVEMTPLSFPL